MITWTFFQNAARMLGESPVLARLVIVSIELALLAGGVALLIWLLRVRAPRLRALLWLLVLAKPILGLAIGTPVPLIHLQQPAVDEVISGEVATGGAELDALVARQLESDRASLAARPFATELPASVQGAEAAAKNDELPLQAATRGETRAPLPIGSLLIGLWIAGVMGFIGITIYDQIRIRKLRHSTSAPPDVLVQRFHSLAHEMKLKRVPLLRITDALESPALVGVLRPDILLPRWLVNEAEPGRLDWFLRHELMHRKLSDPVAFVVRRLAEILFYFHPVVWWAGKKWEEAMELACDRAMIQSQDEAHSYAQNLYQVLTYLKEVKTMKCSNGLFATRTQIGKRIAALLSNPLRSPAHLSAVSFAGLAAIVVLSLAVGLGVKKAAQAQGLNPYETAQSGESEKTVLAGVVPKTADNPLGLSQEVQQKFVKVAQAFVLISVAEAAYYADHHQMPSDPSNLTTPVPYLTKIPDDPFGGAPMHIVFGPKESLLMTVYSVGPDGDSDEGKPINTDDPFLDGDLSISMTAAGLIMPSESGMEQIYEPYVNEEIMEKVVQMPEAGPKVRQLLEQAGFSEAKTRSRVSRANADLRSMHTAMEAYRVDWETYPDVMHSLTTPVAYLTTYFPDPFADAMPPATEEPSAKPTPDPGPRYIKKVIAPDYTAIRLYSVGPDGIDQRGALEYDPTNGTVSSGDIVRTIRVDSYYRIADRTLREKIREQVEQLNSLKSAVEAWYLEHRELPEKLEDLTTPIAYIKSIPEDLFVPGGPISYYLDKERGVATIYSYGPDGDDDAGEKDLKGLVAKDQIPDADIAVKIKLTSLQDRFPQKVTAATAQNDPMMKALLELKEKEGRDNALIHYQLASKLMPGIPQGVQTDLINQVLKQGWSDEDNALIPYIATFQPMFEEIRKGTALDYAMGVGWAQGPATPVPNFLAGQISAKMLCVEGRYLESQGQYRKALDNYMTALTMGRDYSAPEGTLISYLISVAIESISLNQLHHLVASGNLDRTTLDYVLKRLETIEATQGTTADAFRGEANFMKWMIQKMRENPEEAQKKILEGSPYSVGLSADDLRALADRLEAERKRFWDFKIKFIETPYWQRDSEAHEKQLEAMIATFHPMTKIAVPNFLEADVRALVTKSKLRETELATALVACKMDKGRYPKRLSELVPEYFAALPVDPFVGHDYGYKPAPDGSSYVLYGVGPDRKDEGTAMLYDPTNGTISGGDVFFK